MEYEYQLYLNYIWISFFTYVDILLVGDSWGRTIHICRPKNTCIFNCSHFKLYVFAKLEIVWSSLTMLESSCFAIYFGSILGVILFARRSPRSEQDKEKLSNGVSFIPHTPLAAKGKVYYLLLNFGSLQEHLFSHSF